MNFFSDLLAFDLFGVSIDGDIETALFWIAVFQAVFIVIVVALLIYLLVKRAQMGKEKDALAKALKEQKALTEELKIANVREEMLSREAEEAKAACARAEDRARNTENVRMAGGTRIIQQSAPAYPYDLKLKELPKNLYAPNIFPMNGSYVVVAPTPVPPPPAVAPMPVFPPAAMPAVPPVFPSATAQSAPKETK